MYKKLILLVLMAGFFSMFLISLGMAKDINCPNCGTKVDATDEFCSECGAKLTCSCPKCGTTVRVTAKFCSSCGANIANLLLMPEMVYLKGGTFNMGTNANGFRTVKVNGFYIGKFEVTNREYWKYDPKHKGKWSKADYPVESVSYIDAANYCKWLSSKTGYKFRLPTEAEWEYACRGGTTTEYYWGNNMDDSYCWYCRNSNNQVHPVGQKKPNGFGLYDMSGNVAEWCMEYNEYVSLFSQAGPVNIRDGSSRTFRGGAWNYAASFCASGVWSGGAPNSRWDDLGIRLAITP